MTVKESWDLVYEFRQITGLDLKKFRDDDLTVIRGQFVIDLPKLRLFLEGDDDDVEDSMSEMIISRYGMRAREIISLLI